MVVVVVVVVVMMMTMTVTVTFPHLLSGLSFPSLLLFCRPLIFTSISVVLFQTAQGPKTDGQQDFASQLHHRQEQSTADTADTLTTQSGQLVPHVSDHHVTSDDPETTGPGEKLGRLQFSIAYDFQETTLTLRIIRAVDLVAKDFSGTSDPYVKIMLLPDKKRKLTTNVKRKNLNPRWNEVFAFEGKLFKPTPHQSNSYQIHYNLHRKQSTPFKYTQNILWSALNMNFIHI